jgi:hypothetical protein
MNQTELPISDRLAFDRTHLANERTLLAVGIYRYLKTARGLKQYRSGNVNRTKGKTGNA